MDSDLLRVSSRQEWPALLHNLCMLHSLVRLRSRYGLAGWNKTLDLRHVGTAELWVSAVTRFAVKFSLDNLFRVKVGRGYESLLNSHSLLTHFLCSGPGCSKAD